MTKSLREYVVSLGIWGWVVLIDVIGSIVGGYLDISGNVNIPIWVWLSLLLLGLLIAPFIAFHRLRIQRDNINKELKNQEWEYRRKRLIEMREPYLKQLPMILRDMSKRLPIVTQEIIKGLPDITEEQLQEITTYIHQHVDIHSNTIEDYQKYFSYLSWSLESCGVALKRAKANDSIWRSLDRQYYGIITNITDDLLKSDLQDFITFLDGNSYYTLLGAYLDKGEQTLHEKIIHFGSIDGREKLLQDILSKVNRRIEQLRSGDDAK